MTMTPEVGCDWINTSIPFVRASMAFGKIRVVVAKKDSVEFAKRMSRVSPGELDVSRIEITIYDAPFQHIGAWSRNPAVDGFPSVMPIQTTVSAILDEQGANA